MQSGSSNWTRRLEIVLAGAAFTVVALGARDVTDQMRRIPLSRERFERMVRPWCEQISLEVPAEEQAALRAIAEAHPEWLLVACSRCVQKPTSQPGKHREWYHADRR